MASPYDYANGSTSRIPPPSWAKKLGRSLKELFDPTAPDALHPTANISESNSSTATSVDATTATVPNLWKVHQTRKSVYQDINRMDAEDETVATALDIIADCCVAYTEVAEEVKPIHIECDDKEAKKVLEDLTHRLDLQNELWQICRDMVKQGNEFREVVIDRQRMQVAAFKQTISYQIYPNTNEKGDKIPGWVVREDRDLYTNQKGKQLEEWQITPFSFGAHQGFLSIPPLATARRNWIRLSKMEDGMAIARLVRAYDKMVHKIPVKPEMSVPEIMNRINIYKQGITKRRMLDSEGMTTQTDSPLDVQSDFYLPDPGDNRGGVTLLSSNNAQLGNLNDVIYHREKLLTRLQVPISYLQITSAQKTHVASNKGKGSNVELQFARMLRRVHRQAVKGLRRLYDIELMLHGIAPSEDLYAIKLTPINTKDLAEDAEIELTYAQAAVYFVEAFGTLPPELIASKFMHLTKEQSELLEKFMTKYGERLTTAKVKSIELAAKPPPAPMGIKDRLPGDSTPGVGSGNQNKGRASRATEQKGKVNAKVAQSIPMEEMVDLVFDLQTQVNDEFREQGINVPELDESHRTVIRTNIMQVANQNDDILLAE